MSRMACTAGTSRLEALILSPLWHRCELGSGLGGCLEERDAILCERGAGALLAATNLTSCLPLRARPASPPPAPRTRAHTHTHTHPGTTAAASSLQDMRDAGRRFGSSSAQLQLVFKRPLHPFYPPSVQLVSPRFQGPILRCEDWAAGRLGPAAGGGDVAGTRVVVGCGWGRVWAVDGRVGWAMGCL